MQNLVIFGTKEFAQVAFAYLSEEPELRVAAFSVHRAFLDVPEMFGVPVIPFEDLPRVCPPADHMLFVAVGYQRLNRNREELCAAGEALGYRLFTYIDRRAVVAKSARIGEHCFIFEQNVVQPFVEIGKDVIVWSGNHIGHHVSIGDHTFITSHTAIAGRVRIGKNCFVGGNASLREGIIIGDRTVIGMGAVVLRDVPPDSVIAVKESKRSNVPSSRVRL